MHEIKDKIIFAVKEAIANNAEAVDCDYDIIEIDCNDVDHIAEQVADALIAANIGDVTEYKKAIRDLNTDVVAYRALSKADTLEQIIEGQKSLIDEYKHRAEIAEKALKLVSECDELLNAFCELIGEDNCDFKCHTCLYNYFLQQAESKIEEEKDGGNQNTAVPTEFNVRKYRA